jgi:hypothetical protein
MERVLNTIPIVRDTDMTYWNDTSRQILKMHGCINDPSSMVITREDYTRYLSDGLHSLICNKVRDMMATKTFLFVGYSLKDVDFETVYSDILQRIGGFARTAFAVFPNMTKEDGARWKSKGIIVIEGLAYPFLETLRNTLIDGKTMFDVDDNLGLLHSELTEVNQHHFKLDQDTGIGFATAIYQDNLCHMLEDLLERLHTGLLRNDLEENLRVYRKMLDESMTANSNYEKGKGGELFPGPLVARYSGLVHCIEWFLSDPKKKLLKFFSANRLEPIDYDEYRRELESESSPMSKVVEKVAEWLTSRKHGKLRQ